MKVFRSLGHLSSEEALKRFRQEGTSASRLNHPNAVAMLDSGIAPGGIPYLAMELLVGRTLADELRERNQLQLSRCIQIVLPICDVLVEAHAIGLIHRDIKPENVFLHRARYGEVIKVLDFGIAKLLGTDSDLDRPAMTGVAASSVRRSTWLPERLRHNSLRRPQRRLQRRRHAVPDAVRSHALSVGCQELPGSGAEPPERSRAPAAQSGIPASRAGGAPGHAHAGKIRRSVHRRASC